ncbi:DJ-1/PfpI family protein [Mycolicibacterium setense]|uniref:DJ-1/PfpI family protein n=1 Tax=Mycolicibacterium setense TaxID=431269 RepID=UPI000AFF969F
MIEVLAQIVLFDGFAPLDVIAPFDVLAAGRIFTGGAVEVELVSAQGPRQVPSGISPLSLEATARLDPRRADVIVVPGAAGKFSGADELDDDNIAVIQARTLSTELPGLLKEAMERPELTMATVCGGSMVLAAAGLIDGRSATTHHLGMDALAGMGVIAIDARVVDDGDLVTAAGVTSGLDLGIYLLERELGPRIAHAVEALFDYERRGIVWRNTGPEPLIAV